MFLANNNFGCGYSLCRCVLAFCEAIVSCVVIFRFNFTRKEHDDHQGGHRKGKHQQGGHHQVEHHLGGTIMVDTIRVKVIWADIIRVETKFLLASMS